MLKDSPLPCHNCDISFFLSVSGYRPPSFWIHNFLSSVQTDHCCPSYPGGDTVTLWQEIWRGLFPCFGKHKAVKDPCCSWCLTLGSWPTYCPLQSWVESKHCVCCQSHRWQPSEAHTLWTAGDHSLHSLTMQKDWGKKSMWERNAHWAGLDMQINKTKKQNSVNSYCKNRSAIPS